MRIVRIICCGLYAVLEEGDDKKPETVRTYVKSIESVSSQPRYRKAWEDLLELVGK